MERIDTAGNKLPEIVQCPYCNVNTAGNHEPDCPFYINKLANEAIGVTPTKEIEVKMKFVIVEREES